MTEYIDLFMDLSPVGEIELNAGIQELRYQGNWKFMPENSVEGDYHGPFIHRIAFELFRKATGNAGSAGARTDIPDVIRSLPGGHMVQDYRRAGAPGSGRPVNEARNIYSAQLSERYGPEKAKQLLESLAPIVFVFPNLHYVMTHIRVIQPLAADASIVTYQPVMLKGVPDPINEQRLRNHELMFGPAGFVSPDDVEIMERNQEALRATGDDWLFIGRGAHRDRVLPDGGSTGYAMDENHLRGFWKHYASVMSAPA